MVPLALPLGLGHGSSAQSSNNENMLSPGFMKTCVWTHVDWSSRRRAARGESKPHLRKKHALRGQPAQPWLLGNHLSGGLEPLRGCTGLQVLGIGSNELTGGLEPLTGCTALQKLYLSHNQLTGSLEPLQNCTALRGLGLSNNQLTGGLEPLQGCTVLQKLFLTHNLLTGGVEPLEGCTALQELCLANNPLRPSSGTRRPITSRV